MISMVRIYYISLSFVCLCVAFAYPTMDDVLCVVAIDIITHTITFYLTNIMFIVYSLNLQQQYRHDITSCNSQI